MIINMAVSPPFEEIESAVKRALNEFSKYDLQLLKLTADERAVTHQIACYLKKQFPGWHVDCEYNRRGEEPKTSSNGELVRPDIIIHHRAKQNNLLVIEVKKNNENAENDKIKLEEFTKKSGKDGYHFGLLLIISIDPPHDIIWEVYHDGKHFKTIQSNLISKEAPS